MSDWIITLIPVGVFYLLNGIWIGLLVAAVYGGLKALLGGVPAAVNHRLLWLAVAALVMLPLILVGDDIAEHSAKLKTIMLSPDIFQGNQIDDRMEVRRDGGGHWMSWPLFVGIVWLVGVGAFLLRMGVGVLGASSLRGSEWEVEPDLWQKFDQCRRRLGIRRPVQLKFSDRVSSPVAVGAFKPAILFPTHLIVDLTDDEFEQIIMHELGHIYRGDVQMNVCQRLLEAFWWCNPVVWWFGKELALTREMACDDWALRHRSNRREYAQCLMRLASLIGQVRVSSVSLGFLKRRSTLMKRIEYLLGERRASVWLARHAVRIALVIFCLVGVGISQIGPVWDVPGRAEAYMRVAQWSKPLAKILIGNPLPKGIGLTRKVIVVADDARRAELRPVLEDLLLKPVSMPRPEVIYELVYVLPEAFDKYRAYRNLILAVSSDGVTVLDRAIKPLMKSSTGAEMVIRHDIWASDQVVVAIASQHADGAAELVALNGDRIVSKIDASLDQWLASILYHAGEDIEKSADLAQRFGWQVKVPVGYEVMDEYADQNFVAMTRQVDRRQLWLWVYWEDGVHPDDMTADWCLDKRDDVARRFYGGDQTSFGDVDIYEVDFGGKLAVCLEGLWENETAWQGGPFKSYAVYDANLDRFFLINMGIYAPNRTKALQLRQLDALAHTFSVAPSYSMAE